MSWQFPSQSPSSTKKRNPSMTLTHAGWLFMNWIMCERDMRTARGMWGKHLEICLWLPQQSSPPTEWARGKSRKICTVRLGMPIPRKEAKRMNGEKGRSTGNMGTTRPNSIGSPTLQNVNQTPPPWQLCCLPIHNPWTFSSQIDQIDVTSARSSNSLPWRDPRKIMEHLKGTE